MFRTNGHALQLAHSLDAPLIFTCPIIRFSTYEKTVLIDGGD
jgi:hypothetical protein